MGRTARTRRGFLRRQARVTQRGVALIAVVTALSLTGILVKEFSTNTHVDAFSADNTRDQMRAEWLARSSLALSEMILRLQQVLDSEQVQQQLGMPVQITEYGDMFMMAFGGTSEEVADATGLTGDDARAFGADIGHFGVAISTDDGKINVNCGNGKKEYKQLVYTMLQALYYFPAFDPVFQEADADGWRRDRNQQTQAIIDYVDSDTTIASGPGEPPNTATEDYGYDRLKYKAKDNYLDTVDELKLVRGIDDRFWTLFGPAFTVYGGCQVNVRALEDPRIIAAIIFLAAANPEDPVIRDGTLLWYHAQAVAFARSNGLIFLDKPEDLVDFLKDPEAQLTLGLGDQTDQGGGAGAGAAPVAIQIPGVPQGIDLGVELKLEEVKKIIRGGPQRTYRVEAYGEVHRNPPFTPVRRTITAVWDMGTVNVNQRSDDPKSRNGAWVYLRTQ